MRRLSIARELAPSHAILADPHPPDQFQVDKSIDYDLLPSPIRRVFYLSSEGSGQEHEVFPQVIDCSVGEGGVGEEEKVHLSQSALMGLDSDTNGGRCASFASQPLHLSAQLFPSPILCPQANPRALQEIEKSDAIIYGMGSLYTSICPILCLDGMGEMIASREVPKVRQP